MQDTSQIFKSRIMEKASIRTEKGIIIIAVFERSDYYQHFFVFSARTPRSPRAAWKYSGQYFTIYSGKYQTLAEIAADYARFNHGELIKVRRYFRKSVIAGFRDRLINPNRYTIKQPLPMGTFEYANRITAGKPATAYNRRPAWTR